MFNELQPFHRTQCTHIIISFTDPIHNHLACGTISGNAQSQKKPPRCAHGGL
jgi:hypothetical protein